MVLQVSIRAASYAQLYKLLEIQIRHLRRSSLLPSLWIQQTRGCAPCSVLPLAGTCNELRELWPVAVFPVQHWCSLLPSSPPHSPAAVGSTVNCPVSAFNIGDSTCLQLPGIRTHSMSSCSFVEASSCCSLGIHSQCSFFLIKTQLSCLWTEDKKIQFWMLYYKDKSKYLTEVQVRPLLCWWGELKTQCIHFFPCITFILLYPLLNARLVLPLPRWIHLQKKKSIKTIFLFNLSCVLHGP